MSATARGNRCYECAMLRILLNESMCWLLEKLQSDTDFQQGETDNLHAWFGSIADMVYKMQNELTELHSTIYKP